MIWRLVDAALLLVGITLITVGVAKIHPPSAWIIAGVALVALAVIPGIRA